ncbi:interleukin-like EMT inducer domain-containing protein [Sphingomonas sp. I4]
MRLALRKYQTFSSEAGSIAWFIRPYLGFARQGQTEWNPYTPGSAKAVVNATNARITDEATASANRDAAISNRVSTTESQIAGGQDSWLAARIRDEATASSNRDSAIGNRTSNVEAKAKNVATSFTAVSRGNGTGAKFGRGAGVYNVDGANFTGGGRGYRVNVFDKNNNLSSTFLFDTLAADRSFSSGGAGDLANHLNGIQEGDAVIITTDDEPQSNRLTGGLVEAMERCGAGPLFTGNTFKYRGAYILVGQAGIGKGNGNEYYSGSTDNAADAWIEARFDLLNGRPQLNGAGKAIIETNAAVRDEATARANSDTAQSNRITDTEAKLSGGQDSWLAARIRDEATASANRDLVPVEPRHGHGSQLHRRSHGPEQLERRSIPRLFASEWPRHGRSHRQRQPRQCSLQPRQHHRSPDVGWSG